MATNPQLVVALEARLDKFEAQLKQAGVIAERAVSDIEDKFSRANPAFGGGFAGGLLGGLLSGGVRVGIAALVHELKNINSELAQIGETAKVTGFSLDELQKTRFAITSRSTLNTSGTFGGLEEMAKLLNDAQRNENSLTKILDANNIKYQERDGTIISSNKALGIAADLVARAKTEGDKLDIAKAFGFGKEFVPALEDGRQALEDAGKKAEKLGLILDDSVIAKAQAFRKAWEEATAIVAIKIQAALGESTGPGSVWDQFIANTKNEIELLGKLGDKLLEIKDKFIEALGPAGTKLTLFGNRQEAFGPALPANFRSPPPPGPFTNVPSKETGGGKDAFESALEQARKRNALMEADTRTVGLNTEERERARVVATLQEAAIRANTAAGLENTEVTQKQKEQIEQMADAALDAAAKLRKAQELVSAFKEVGQAFSEAFKGMVLEGKKLDDVLKSLANRLASKAFDKLFENLFSTGSGSLASFFGGARASGGPVNVGKSYIVGERGPELFRPSVSGMISPNMGGGGGNQIVNVQIDNRSGAQIDTKQSRGSNGSLNLKVIVDQIKSEISGDIAAGRGSIPSAMSSRFGLNPARGNAR
jgi:hypothetical protein